MVTQTDYRIIVEYLIIFKYWIVLETKSNSSQIPDSNLIFSSTGVRFLLPLSRQKSLSALSWYYRESSDLDMEWGKHQTQYQLDLSYQCIILILFNNTLSSKNQFLLIFCWLDPVIASHLITIDYIPISLRLWKLQHFYYQSYCLFYCVYFKKQNYLSLVLFLPGLCQFSTDQLSDVLNNHCVFVNVTSCVQSQSLDLWPKQYNHCC